jgi:hypothetical protein
MDEAWQVLMDAGLPLAGVRRPSTGQIRRDKVSWALAEISVGAAVLDTSRRDCLFAWLRAFRHHWPDRFAQVLGTRGETVLRQLAPHVSDTNRYIKLRRIAVENLANLL